MVLMVEGGSLEAARAAVRARASNMMGVNWNGTGAQYSANGIIYPSWGEAWAAALCMARRGKPTAAALEQD